MRQPSATMNDVEFRMDTWKNRQIRQAMVKQFRPSMGLALALFALLPAQAKDLLDWRTNGVSADIRSSELIPVLEQIAVASGWHVFLEPGLTNIVSAKFKNVRQGDALHSLLGDLNFALVPETNRPSRLFVFRTAQRNATRFINPVAQAGSGVPRIIPNELIVRLKPGANIDEIAKRLGARVIGRLDGLNAYRLQFDDAESAEAARAVLAGAVRRARRARETAHAGGARRRARPALARRARAGEASARGGARGKPLDEQRRPVEAVRLRGHLRPPRARGGAGAKGDRGDAFPAGGVHPQAVPGRARASSGQHRAAAHAGRVR